MIANYPNWAALFHNDNVNFVSVTYFGKWRESEEQRTTTLLFRMIIVGF